MSQTDEDDITQVSIATRTIIFDTKSHLGLNIGILIAWFGISICTISAITLLRRRPARRRTNESREDLVMNEMQDESLRANREGKQEDMVDPS